MSRSKGKHGTKYLSLSSVDIAKEKILLPGRRTCICEATKHALINNCLECGRIVCEQEGSGPCFTCGKLVCTPKEQEVIIRQSKASLKLYEKLMQQECDMDLIKTTTLNDAKLQSALEHRDKLLEYDRTVEKRTRVIDDENDYFQVDSKWMTDREKKILSKKKEEHYDLLHNRQKQKFSFDFAGRKIIEETPDLSIDVEELLKPDTSIFECKDFSTEDLPMDVHPIYEDPEHHEMNYFAPPSNKEHKRFAIRIQDKELQEMSDEGNCLSLHQPYASLLAAGIKINEGREWYSSYRGRLWIHAAGKVPTKDDIETVENLYRRIQSHCTFPKSYPHGCLLGCVDVVDCLTQEEYRAQYPEGEVGSSYVFICESAQELPIKFPMKGKFKIFKLESNIHQAAKKTLHRKNIPSN